VGDMECMSWPPARAITVTANKCMREDHVVIIALGSQFCSKQSGGRYFYERDWEEDLS